MSGTKLTKADCATHSDTPFSAWLKLFNKELTRRGLPEAAEDEARDAYDVGQTPFTEANEVEVRLAA